MVTFAIHTLHKTRSKKINPARIGLVQVNNSSQPEALFTEDQTATADFVAFSTPAVSPEFADLIYGLKKEYAWVLDELAKP